MGNDFFRVRFSYFLASLKEYLISVIFQIQKKVSDILKEDLCKRYQKAHPSFDVLESFHFIGLARQSNFHLPAFFDTRKTENIWAVQLFELPHP